MYAGQTKHHLKLRVAEHKAAIRNGYMDYAIARHYKEKNHGSASNLSALKETCKITCKSLTFRKTVELNFLMERLSYLLELLETVRKYIILL